MSLHRSFPVVFFSFKRNISGSDCDFKRCGCIGQIIFAKGAGLLIQRRNTNDLSRNTENSIQRIDKKAALPMLCQQSYRPCSPIGAQKTLALVDRLGSSVPLYRLGCNMEPEAALVAYHGMNQ